MWRAPTGLGLPDGTYLTVLINPAIRGARRHVAILDADGDTIAVSPFGWTDLSEVRLTGQRWLRQQ